MARLIVKSPYFKGGGAKPAGGYLRYIATRERVEILPDDRPPTKRQTQLIEKLTKDFPDIWDWLRGKIMWQHSMHWASCSSRMIQN